MLPGVGDTLYRELVSGLPLLVHRGIGLDTGIQIPVIRQPGDVDAAAVGDKILTQQGTAAAVQAADLHTGEQRPAHAVVRVGGIDAVQFAVLRKSAALGQAQPRITDPGFTVRVVMGAAGLGAQHPLYSCFQVHGGEAPGVVEISGSRLVQLTTGSTGDIAARPDHVQRAYRNLLLPGGCLGRVLPGRRVRGGGGCIRLCRDTPGVCGSAGAQGKQQGHGQGQLGNGKPFHPSSASNR